MFTFTHLSTGGQLDRQRQRDLLARAGQQPSKLGPVMAALTWA